MLYVRVRSILQPSSSSHSSHWREEVAGGGGPGRARARYGQSDSVQSELPGGQDVSLSLPATPSSVYTPTTICVTETIKPKLQFTL